MHVDLVGIAAIITAIGAILTPLLTVFVILRVNHVVHLTNSNFSGLQATLDAQLSVNAAEREMAASRAAGVAETAATTAAGAASQAQANTAAALTAATHAPAVPEEKES